MKKQLFAIALFTTTIASAQIDTSKSTVNFSGYVEATTPIFNSPDNHNRPGFFYSHPRHNEFNLNLDL
jgi:hypothetical protein